MKNSFGYYLESDLPVSHYYRQWSSVEKLEVGKVYRQEEGIYFVDYEIVHIGHGVALGVEVANGNGNFAIGKKELFSLDPEKMGWKYNDNRPQYRLVREV